MMQGARRDNRLVRRSFNTLTRIHKPTRLWLESI
jgi:hypothetical protein